MILIDVLPLLLSLPMATLGLFLPSSSAISSPVILNFNGSHDTVNTGDLLDNAVGSKTDVVNFIISDLDLAVSKLKKKSEVPAQRISRDIASILLSRVALYEGTWEKYHQNDAFKGKTNGDAFLTKAAQAAKAVIDGGIYSLVTGNPNQVYYEIFNQVNLSNNPEI